MMTLAKVIGIHLFNITVPKIGRSIVGFQRSSRSVTYRPAGFFFVLGFTLTVAGCANLHRNAHGQFSRVDNRLAFFKYGGFGQNRVPGALAMAGFTADTRLDEGSFIKIDTRGVTPAAS